MTVLKLILEDLGEALKRVAPGVIAVLVVMVLLRGFSGSLEAIKLQIRTLATSFLGAGEGMIGVLLHTLPLALAASVATFAIARRMIRFESQLSILALALIVMIGATVGGFLRQFAPEPKPNPHPALAEAAIASVREKTQPTAGNLPIGIGVTNALPHDLVSLGRDETVLPSVSQSSPIDKLRSIDWLARPELSQAPPREIAPLDLLPQTGGVLGAAAWAINQLLAYLIAYQPRLFLAAIVAGGWVGWSWHRRLERITAYAEDRWKQDESAKNVKPELRRAA